MDSIVDFSALIKAILLFEKKLDINTLWLLIDNKDIKANIVNLKSIKVNVYISIGSKVNINIDIENV